ncbi:hypothetical protein POJ06DRAFT_197090 [Lipomyces tetrasporus]|uniref:Ketoreductase domain-containing protein n=1 Tax=Lipomyces tetrasporus TaxID=54092 RepID=A0AAD7QSF6_9ASCO|nr:uncharacterized protein POJ06DRAFT_197090 [Lipomyces tetrasporus]KAJ8100441.1 hypothetical protein POJ06DRAFT_197090 [Lipomyces tetrasporus]
MFSVRDKIALVTGGSRGLGLYAAHGLLTAGATKVYISSRSGRACDEAAKELNGDPTISGKAVAIAGNFANPDEIKRVFEFIEKDSCGKLDIVVANAGATWGAPLESHPAQAFDRVFDLNVKGVFLTVQAAAPLLAQSGDASDPARVIVVGSITGLSVASNGGGGTYGYLASKAAVHHLARSLAVELGPRNITVNAIAPGFFPTKMSQGLINMVGGELLAEINPRGRLGLPEDIEGVIVYLCSKAGSYVNGAVIPLDGGQHLVSKM